MFIEDKELRLLYVVLKFENTHVVQSSKICALIQSNDKNCGNYIHKKERCASLHKHITIFMTYCSHWRHGNIGLSPDISFPIGKKVKWNGV